LSQLDLKKAASVKLIVCDLDGTLLNSRKQISQANVASLQAARSRGIVVTICTSRIPQMTAVYAKELAIDDYYIASNGAVIIDARDDSMPYCKYADGTETASLLEFSKREDLNHVLSTDQGCYCSTGNRRIPRYIQYNELAVAKNLIPIPLYQLEDHYHEVSGMNIYKVLLSDLTEIKQQRAEDFLRTLNLRYVTSEPGVLDINAGGIDKGTGVRTLAEMFGLSKEEICVFGDYSNDLPMFEAAGFSVAMGNGNDEVKRRATVVTATNDEDGVAAAIKQYVLGDNRAF